jgi:hypothetical protein
MYGREFFIEAEIRSFSQQIPGIYGTWKFITAFTTKAR